MSMKESVFLSRRKRERK